jgi:hypothetical protein
LRPSIGPVGWLEEELSIASDSLDLALSVRVDGCHQRRGMEHLEPRSAAFSDGLHSRRKHARETCQNLS